MRAATHAPRILPVYVAGGPCHPACRWCEPTQGLARPLWRDVTPDQVRATVASAGARAERRVLVSFYGGGVLDLTAVVQRALAEELGLLRAEGAIDGVRIAARPDQVSAATLTPWIDAGLEGVELEVPTLWPAALRWLGPSHQPQAVGAAVETLRALGLSVAAHTSPGLPGSDPAADLDTAEAVLALGPDFVRITPAIVIAGTHLEQAWRRGLFRPMDVPTAVELGRRLMDVHDLSAVPVVRYGWQPADLRVEKGQIIAGPSHPSLRTLVESSRMFEHATRLMQLRVRPGQEALLSVHPSEATYLRGLQNSNLQRLRHRFRCRRLDVAVDAALAPGVLALDVDGRRLTLGRGERFAS